MDIQNYDFEKIDCDNGLTLYLNNDPTLNTTVIRVYSHSPVNGNETERMLVPSLLKQGSENYADETQLSKALDYNYGSRLWENEGNVGLTDYVGLKLTTVNKPLLDGDQTNPVYEGIKILSDIINSPYNATEQEFNDPYFRKVVRKAEDFFSARKSDKSELATEKMLHHLFGDHPLATTLESDEIALKNVKNADVFAAYKETYTTGNTELYVSGSFDRDTMIEKLKSIIPEGSKTIDKSPRLVFNGEREIKEFDDVEQTQVRIAYSLDSGNSPEDFATLSVVNKIISTKLFNNVREKHSLCYGIKSSTDDGMGLLTLTAGVDSEKYELARDLMLEDVRKVVENKDYTEKEFETAKKEVINSIKGALSNNDYRIKQTHTFNQKGFDIGLNEWIKTIEHVKFDDLNSAVARVDTKTPLIYALCPKEVDK